MVAGPENTTILHLSTFGSDDRHSAPKSSQSLQIDEVIASELLKVIRGTFPNLFGELGGSESKGGLPVS